MVSAEAWEFCKLEFKREFGSSALFTRVSPRKVIPRDIPLWTLFFEIARHVITYYRGDLDHIWKLPGSFAEES